MADYLMGDDLLGEDFDDVEGVEDGEEVGAVLARAKPIGVSRLPKKGFFAGRKLQLPPRPAWRSQLSPGVPMPGETMEPLPLTPSLNNGVFAAGGPQGMVFTARPQRPFRGERVISTVAKTPGASGVVPVISGGIIVGTQIQSVEIGNLPLEIFAPGAFGVRLNLASADPGVLISARVELLTAIPAGGGDTVACTLTILGRSIR